MRLETFDVRNIVPIVGDGGIADPEWGDGRPIPVLVIDCAKHPQVSDLILLPHNPPGDVISTWIRRRFDKKRAFLRLEFERPVNAKVILRFRLDRQAGLVDGIIRARGVYLQSLETGRRVSEGVDKPKILVEVPGSTTFPGDWSALYRSVIARSYRRRGVSRREALRLAEEHLKSVAGLWDKRMRGGV